MDIDILSEFVNMHDDLFCEPWNFEGSRSAFDAINANEAIEAPEMQNNELIEKTTLETWIDSIQSSTFMEVDDNNTSETTTDGDILANFRSTKRHIHNAQYAHTSNKLQRLENCAYTTTRPSYSNNDAIYEATSHTALSNNVTIPSITSSEVVNRSSSPKFKNVQGRAEVIGNLEEDRDDSKDNTETPFFNPKVTSPFTTAHAESTNISINPLINNIQNEIHSTKYNNDSQNNEKIPSITPKVSLTFTASYANTTNLSINPLIQNTQANTDLSEDAGDLENNKEAFTPDGIQTFTSAHAESTNQSINQSKNNTQTVTALAEDTGSSEHSTQIPFVTPKESLTLSAAHDKTTKLCINQLIQNIFVNTDLSGDCADLENNKESFTPDGTQSFTTAHAESTNQSINQSKNKTQTVTALAEDTGASEHSTQIPSVTPKGTLALTAAHDKTTKLCINPLIRNTQVNTDLSEDFGNLDNNKESFTPDDNQTFKTAFDESTNQSVNQSKKNTQTVTALAGDSDDAEDSTQIPSVSPKLIQSNKIFIDLTEDGSDYGDNEESYTPDGTLPSNKRRFNSFREDALPVTALVEDSDDFEHCRQRATITLKSIQNTQMNINLTGDGSDSADNKVSYAPDGTTPSSKKRRINSFKEDLADHAKSTNRRIKRSIQNTQTLIDLTEDGSDYGDNKESYTPDCTPPCKKCRIKSFKTDTQPVTALAKDSGHSENNRGVIYLTPTVTLTRIAAHAKSTNLSINPSNPETPIFIYLSNDKDTSKGIRYFSEPDNVRSFLLAHSESTIRRINMFGKNTQTVVISEEDSEDSEDSSELRHFNYAYLVYTCCVEVLHLNENNRRDLNL